MRILYRYILKSHLLSLGLSLFIFTFVLLLSNAVKETIKVVGDIGFLNVLHCFFLLMPYILSFSTPMALLAATLLVMGRLTADNELTAARACGISFFELTLPIIGIGALLSFGSLWINSTLAPQMRYAFNQTLIEIALRDPIALLEEGEMIKNFPGIVLRFEKRDLKNKTLHDIHIYRMQNDVMTQDIQAKRGEIVVNQKLKKIEIKLFDGRIDNRSPEDPHDHHRNQRDITFSEYPLDPLDITRLVEENKAKRELHHKSSQQLWDDILEFKAKNPNIHPTPMLVEIHKRIALSFACLAFVFIALPFGIRVQRKETSIGILISLVLAVLYYVLIIFAESFKTRPEVYPELIIWIPNLLFQTIGLYMLWKQTRT